MTSVSRRILVVDDDPASCELLAYSLKSLGYNVAIAADGTRAMNMNLDDDIELVILDVHLPLYSGPEILAMLRERHVSRQVKFLALTADESTDARESMIRSGADGFLTKPVDLVALREEVSRLVPGHSQSGGALLRRVRQRGLGHVVSERPTNPRAGLLRGDG
jgi:DNA-binding response OmpR family regulator